MAGSAGLHVTLSYAALAKPARLQLQPTDHVADLRQWLLSLAEYSYITCFAVELDGERVLPTAQFQSLAGFRQGCTVKIVPMTYDARQVGT